MAADVSVLTLTRHHPEHVKRVTACLDAAQAAAPDLQVERILVNNGAPALRRTWDPVTKWAAAHRWAVAEPGYNTSYSEGNNLAARAASGRWLLLLNDDARFGPDLLARLWESRERAHVLGCLILHGDGTVNHAGTKLVPWPDHVGRHDPAARWRRNAVEAREAVTFACALVQAEWYRKLDGLDERYFYSFEDTDFCLRTLEAGGHVAVNLGAEVEHDECGTRERGGRNDVDNAAVYRAAWPEEKVRGTVAAYWDRIK